MIKEIIRFLSRLFQSDKERAKARVAEIFTPQALARHPQLAQEAVRIEQARRQASAILPMIRDALIAPENTAAERRYGSALKQAGASATTGSEMRKAGKLEQIANLTNASQRGTVAWAKQVPARHGVEGSKYATGTDAFVDNAEWGALLEDLIPQLPKPVRQAMAVPMDLFIDPLAAVSPAKAYDLVLDAIYKLSPDIGSIISHLGLLASAKIKQALHPSFYKFTEAAQTGVKPAAQREQPRSSAEILADLIDSIRRSSPPDQQEYLIAETIRMMKPHIEAERQANRAIARLKRMLEEKAKHQMNVLSDMELIEAEIPMRLTNTEADPLSVRDLYNSFLEEKWFDLSPKEFMPLLDDETYDFVLRKLEEQRRRTGRSYLYHKTIPDIKSASTAEILRRLKERMKPKTWAEEIYSAIARTKPAQQVGDAMLKLAQFLANEPLRDVISRERWWYDRLPESETIEKLARIIPFIRGFYPVAPHLARGAWENPYRFIMLSRILNRTNTGEFGQSK